MSADRERILSSDRKYSLTMGGFGCLSVGVLCWGNFSIPIDIVDVIWGMISAAWILNGADLLRWRWEMRRG